MVDRYQPNPNPAKSQDQERQRQNDMLQPLLDRAWRRLLHCVASASASALHYKGGREENCKTYQRHGHIDSSRIPFRGHSPKLQPHSLFCALFFSPLGVFLLLPFCLFRLSVSGYSAWLGSRNKSIYHPLSLSFFLTWLHPSPLPFQSFR